MSQQLDGIVVLAGATGHLGGLIAKALGNRVRPVTRADFASPARLARACDGAACVVSALAGPRETIIDAQSTLLDAAVAAKVPRFIPSDFAIDFYKMPDGYNRNLDLRREFREKLDAAPIAATSILCGMFMELLAGQAPFIVKRFKRVVYWQNLDQSMDFTAIGDVATYTAAAALDPSTPRFLRIAGHEASARDLTKIASAVYRDRFKPFRAGQLSRLEKLIRFVKRVAPGEDETYPPWQGMQYMHNMYDGRPKLQPLDNERYPSISWTSIDALLRTAD